jgi:hypothetical protein
MEPGLKAHTEVARLLPSGRDNQLKILGKACCFSFVDRESNPADIGIQRELFLMERNSRDILQVEEAGLDLGVQAQLVKAA